MASLPADIRRRVVQRPLIASDKELSVFYSSLDCFLHAANQGESFGYVLTEAMLCGCPVVTACQPFKDNSQVEVVGHLRGGVVAGSLAGLGPALSCLRRDHDLRRTIAATARDHVLTRYDADKTAALVVEIAAMALRCRSHADLFRTLADDVRLRTDTSDDQILWLCNNVQDRPSRIILPQLKAVNSRLSHRLWQTLRRLFRRT